MQHKKFKGFRSFIKGKGYYIVLLLSAAAVGVSGFFLFKDGKPVQKDPTEESASQVENADTAPTATQQVTDVVATGEATVPTTQEAEKTVLRPVDGAEIYAFAADHLAFNETTRDWRTHEAIDYSAELGQSVFAAADGTVHTIYEDDSLGMTVVLRHTDGITTHYSNLDKAVAVTVGQTVKAGDVLGTVGQTACVESASVPHLHFAVCRNGVPIDPELFLAPN